MRKALSLVILVSMFLVGYSQDASLVDLKTNPALTKQIKKNNSRAASIDLIYIIDTLELPFIDDFSKNFQLRYRDYDPGDPYVIDSAQSVYRFGNEVKDTIKYRLTPSYSYYYSSITNNVDTIENDSVKISIYNADIESFLTYDYGWLNEENYYSNGQLVLTQEITYDSILYDSVWYKYYVKDTSKHWIDNHVWINTTMAVDPPTIGVATFDGIDSLGHPYNLSGEGAYGLADYLTSYPINLQGKTNVKISFYYQPQGLGNIPEERDSLVLEFLGNGVWKYAWSAPGDSLADFQYVEVPITDSIYLVKGFKFRFKNYATLSGSLDHWHIDYVYLDADRTGNSTAINDLAFREVPRTLINNYMAMPYEHYLDNPASHMVNDVDLDLVNLSSLDLSGKTDYRVIDWNNGTQVFDAEDLNIISFPSFSKQSYNHSVLATNNQFQFPNSGNYTNTYKIQYIANSNTIQASEVNHHNDTITVEQIFDNYYAYDDGSPESGFAIAGEGATVALQFTLLAPDTITGVLINFLEMFDDVDNTFTIKLWKDQGGFPDIILYESEIDTVPVLEQDEQYRTPITFKRYEIDSLIILPIGVYHIGWTQTRLNKFFVGYDRNNDATDKFLYNIGAGWTSFIEPGALLIRPEFGESELKPIISISVDDKFKQNVLTYPNPASDDIAVRGHFDGQYNISIIDGFGRLVLNKQVFNNQKIDVTQLSNGVYWLFVDADGETSTQKLVIQH